MRRGPGPKSVRSLVVFAAGSVIAIAALGALPATAQAQPATPVQTAAVAQTFTDIRGNEWFAGAVEALAVQGIVNGRDDGSFGPSDPVTRAQLAAFLARALDLPERITVAFTDVGYQDWFSGAVGALCEAGIVSGTDSNTFSPNEAVSRQQAATLVMRSLSYILERRPQMGVGYALADDQAGVWLAGFRDRNLIAPAHSAFVANACRLGVVEGTADGWFYPTLTLSRAQMAVMLYRALLQPVAARNVYPTELPAVSTYARQSVGSEGTLVSFLEARLTALHYPCGPVDGVYDYRTRDAVMAFEKVEELQRDGTVGAEVWQRIFSAQAPIPRRSLGGTRCEVDLTRQVLLMITDNRVWKIVHVSTGRLGTRTGHYVVGAKYEGWVRCVTLEGEMYYPSYIVSKTAIHGYRSVPPYPASHGCVRVPVWMAVELYYQLQKGTPVDVYY
jgi:N-acetylmuramoyl-L-alanine amidase